MRFLLILNLFVNVFNILKEGLSRNVEISALEKELRYWLEIFATSTKRIKFILKAMSKYMFMKAIEA